MDCEIALISNSKYIPYTCACIASVVESSSVPLNIHVISDGLTDREKELVTTINNNKDVFIETVDLDEDVLSNYKGTAHLSRNTFAKMFLPSLLPNLDKILYMDGDMTARKNIGQIFSTEMDGMYIAAVKDFGINCIWRIENGEPLPGTEDNSHVNCGLMLMDLDKMRSDKIEELLKGVKPKGRLCDQYVLNKALHGKIKFLHPSSNVSFASVLDDKISEYNDIDKINRLYGTSYKNPIEYVDDAVVWHYNGNKDRVLKGFFAGAEFSRCVELAKKLFPLWIYA